MKTLRGVNVGCMVLMGTMLASTAIGGDWDRKAVVTFADPVDTPGISIPKRIR